MSESSILVAFGGVSPEHEVSVLTAMQAISGLKEKGYHPRPLYITKTGKWLTGDILLNLENFQDLKKLESEAVPCTLAHSETGKPELRELKKAGLLQGYRHHPVSKVLVAFHGSEGENGSFQGLCETFNLPYTGSGVFGSSAGMDKQRAKDLCRSAKIPVVDGFVVHEEDWAEEMSPFINKATQIGFPLIVKPVHLGSSIGVLRADDEKELEEALESSFRYDAELLVEKAIEPLMEINCAVLGDEREMEVSACERPIGSSETLSFEDKYQRGDDSGGKGMASADREVPADIPEKLRNQIQELSRSIFKLFRAGGVARIDFLVNAETQQVYFNEINTIPGSFSFYLWEESGYTIANLMEKLLTIGDRRHKQKNSRVRSYETNLLSEKAVKGLKGLKTQK